MFAFVLRAVALLLMAFCVESGPESHDRDAAAAAPRETGGIRGLGTADSGTNGVLHAQGLLFYTG